MSTSIRKTPLDLLREALVKKTYRAVIRDDATLLPIEERLGRRLLRTLSPDSREGRALLRRGDVTLRRADGTAVPQRSFERLLERLSKEASARLASSPDPDSRRACRDALQRITRSRRALARDH